VVLIIFLADGFDDISKQGFDDLFSRVLMYILAMGFDDLFKMW